MHKNAYNPKVLNGNWFENRFTDEYDKKTSETTNTYLPGPSASKYVPISRDIGNQPAFKKVSGTFYFRKTLVTPRKT
jgi:hypothetical protein